jgi:FAD:protein FMN transferase
MRCTLALAALALALGSGCGRVPTPEGERFAGRTMGTTYEVRLGEIESESERIVLARAVEEALEEVNRKMSADLPDSEISRFNRAAAGIPVPITTATFDVVRESVRVSEETGGAFDVTVAPLVRLWGFGAGAFERSTRPSEDEIARARSKVGYGEILLDDDAIELTKKVEGLECDLSGIARGYAVDRVAAALEARGHRDYMVDVGGEVRTLGKDPAGEAWQVEIEKPGAPGASAREREIERVVPLSGLSMSTAGHRSTRELEAKRYSELIDPRTGRPVEGDLASVTVIDETCMRADALASGLLVLGPVVGFDLAVQKDLTVLFLVRSADGRIVEKATPSFTDLFDPDPQP